jgi:hypothetical protein
MVRLSKTKKKTSSGRAERKTKAQTRADRIILDTAPNPNPDAPSNKANLEQNEKIAEANE